MDFVFFRKLLTTFIFTRHMTPKRFANLLLILVQHFFIRGDRVLGKPIRLIIDPTNHCNLACPLCPTGQGRSERQRSVMDLAHFKHLIDEVADYLFEINLYGWGEPLLNRHVFAMIRYAAERNIRVTMSSHLNYLTAEMAEQLVSSGLHSLIVSLDGASPATYEVYRQNGNFERVCANVERLALEKIRQGRKTPVLIWQFLTMKHNAHETDIVRSQYRQFGFNEMLIRPIRCDMGRELEMTSDAEKINSVKAWLPDTNELSRYDYEAQKRKYHPKNCLFLWTQGVVHPDGNVSPCCAIYDPKDDVGNAFEQSFMSVWNNQAYRALREQVRTKRGDNHSPCGNCIVNGFIEY